MNEFDRDELEAIEWALWHAIRKHGFSGLSGRHGSYVDLKPLAEKVARIREEQDA